MEWRETELSAEQLSAIADAGATLHELSAAACAVISDLDARVIGICGDREVFRQERLEELTRAARVALESDEGGFSRWGDRLADDGKYFCFAQVVVGALLLVVWYDDRSSLGVVRLRVRQCEKQLREILDLPTPLPPDSGGSGDPPAAASALAASKKRTAS